MSSGSLSQAKSAVDACSAESEGLSTLVKDIGEPEVRAFIHQLDAAQADL